MDFEESITKQIGKTIRARRKSKGYTIEDLAYHSEVNDSTIERIERGKATAKIPTLFKIAAGLNLKSPYELLVDADKNIYPKLKEELKKDD
ncbi:helix-turn-helix domain-containing protein [Halalkalibacter urbisdiaboli]|uniref:helix-turn-helix domain-containing protein n=1 Tax=Halalkalibacter urbisdiaboli TaxID=1960589 RepID=UPI0013FDCA44|nr:helix-turn-helix transcriptional regulator [Halalkalibacter urbisdiaboli]